MTDHQIILGCLAKDRKSQKALYDSYSGQMYSICLRYLPYASDATEALQRGFIKVFDKLDSYNHKGALGAWIRSIIVRTAIDVIKERKKLSFQDIDDIELADESSIEYTTETSNLDFQNLMNLLSGMPEGYRLVFTLFVLDDMSHAEIASMLDTSVATSRSQLHKARKWLQESFKYKYGQFHYN